MLDCQVGPALPDDEERPDITIALDKAAMQIGDDASVLATLHYVFVAAPAYLETYGTPKSMASAAGDHRTIKQTGQRSQRETWSERATAIETLASFAFETNSSASCVNALRAGAGVATVPTYLFRTAPELKVIGQERSTPIKLWLVVHQEARNAARVARVAEWLKTIFDSRTNPWFREEFVHPEEFDPHLREQEAVTAPPVTRRSKR
jgi:DNA-binding transcriptional LysR family regulator